MRATGIEVPADVVEQLSSGKRPKVVVTIRGYSYRSTVAVMGGRYLIALAAAHREKAGVAGGDRVRVTLELDTADRTVEVPKDFAAAMRKAPGTRAAFDALSYTHRKEHVRAIEDAKKPETRARRIATAIGILSGDRRR
ncbi:MAG: DUF1905 domain-containing protein [Acidobacteria bacterium]|nr:DUF1905 domain-containing protein [Acidobacteriota bacterium]